ncbi:hypothetical protein [Streptomyces avicenniae]|uniref:hypothetical protein n=1 Tax=Streptomyces avicenniae TaxID=500153 RepID=UPI00069B65F8|nr:hypothetical protein [Streptomyces avicenniae]
MTDSLRALLALCPPPAAPRRPVGSGEAATRYAVPDSHRELVDAYGVGCFDEFLWIYGAGAENPYLDIAAATDSMGSLLRDKEIPAIRKILRPYGLAPEQLVQWGGTDNGDSLFWLPAGPPDVWPTLIIEAGQLDSVLVERDSTGLVLDLLTGALRVRIFPYDFPSEQPDFSSNPYA